MKDKRNHYGAINSNVDFIINSIDLDVTCIYFKKRSEIPTQNTLAVKKVATKT